MKLEYNIRDGMQTVSQYMNRLFVKQRIDDEIYIKFVVTEPIKLIFINEDWEEEENDNVVKIVIIDHDDEP